LDFAISLSNKPERFRVDRVGLKLEMFRDATSCYYDPKIFLKKQNHHVDVVGIDAWVVDCCGYKYWIS
jgi:hypothetical protein